MSAKDAYHHGNLRRALLDEALAVIAEKGVEGLSLREVAARVGVSHAAPTTTSPTRPRWCTRSRTRAWR